MAITVVDEETSEPIADAYVIVQWEGFFRYAISRVGECYHAEWAKTDRDGVARIPGWKADVSRSNESWFTKVFWREVEPTDGYLVTVLRYGYLNRIKPHKRSASPPTISIRRTENTDEARAKGLGDFSLGCREDVKDAGNSLLLSREIAQVLAAAPNSRALVEQKARVCAYLAFYEGWAAFQNSTRTVPPEWEEGARRCAL